MKGGQKVSPNISNPPSMRIPPCPPQLTGTKITGFAWLGHTGTEGSEVPSSSLEDQAGKRRPAPTTGPFRFSPKRPGYNKLTGSICEGTGEWNPVLFHSQKQAARTYENKGALLGSPAGKTGNPKNNERFSSENERKFPEKSKTIRNLQSLQNLPGTVLPAGSGESPPAVR
jgi:hypothetical protein